MGINFALVCVYKERESELKRVIKLDRERRLANTCCKRSISSNNYPRASVVSIPFRPTKLQFPSEKHRVVKLGSWRRQKRFRLWLHIAIKKDKLSLQIQRQMLKDVRWVRSHISSSSHPSASVSLPLSPRGWFHQTWDIHCSGSWILYSFLV